LSSVLSATTEISAAADDIQSLGIENLDLLAAGPRPLLPGELLGSARMIELLQWARSQYDQVLIDLPPLAGQIDAAIVGRLAEGVVLVVQPEINRRARVDRTVQQLSDFGVRIAGVVANRASPYGAFGQGDGYAYRYAETAIGNVANDPALEEWAIEDAAPTAPPSSSLDDIRPRRVA
jgi:Mrp family chromosome partitioning ATPase